MSGTVLVGVDGSAASRHALDWACLFAARSGLGVRAVMAWQPNDEDTSGDRRTHRGPRLAHLTEVVADVGCESLELGVVQGLLLSPWLAAASDPEIVLLVIGRRGLGTVPDLLLGSVARSLLHAPPCPVVLVPASPPGRLAGSIRHRHGHRRGRDERCSGGAHLPVGRHDGRQAHRGPVYRCRRRVLVRPTRRGGEPDRAEVEERWCAPLMDANSVFIVDVRNAEARRGIMAAVEASGAGMLVVGLHGAGQFRGIGGTTSYLARHWRRPLVVVPPDGPPPSHIGYRL